MAVNESFRSFVLDQLSRVAPNIRSRSMFGGVGIYSADFFFALIDGDTLYLKVDDSNRGDFEARGLGPFRPFGEDGETMQYYQLDEAILEDVNELRPWVDKAIAVARAKRATKRKPAKVVSKKPVSKAVKKKTPRKRRT
jgi:DNA transformation protein and related proteins